MTQNNTDKQTDKPVVLSFSKQGAMMWASGLVGLLMLFFFIGTLVGRNMIRVDLGQDGLYFEIVGLTEVENQSDLSEMATMPDTQQEFEFYDALQKDVDSAAVTGHPKTMGPKNKKVVKSGKKVVAPEKIKPKQDAPRTVTPPKQGTGAKPTVAKAKPAAPAIKPSPLPANPLSLDPATFKYTIQAASFKKALEADNMVADLKQKGYAAYRVKGKVRNSEIWFRVRVGAFKDRMSANPILAQLKKDQVDAFFVKR